MSGGEAVGLMHFFKIPCFGRQAGRVRPVYSDNIYMHMLVKTQLSAASVVVVVVFKSRALHQQIPSGCQRDGNRFYSLFFYSYLGPACLDSAFIVWGFSGESNLFVVMCCLAPRFS